MFAPNGPVGKLIDISSEGRMSIGQQAQLGYTPIYGWTVASEGNYAFPALWIPGQPPPGAIEAMLAAQSYFTQQANTEEELMAAMLLTMF